MLRQRASYISDAPTITTGSLIMRRFAIDQALRTAGSFTAHHADGLELVHAFGNAQKDWHTAKRLTAKIGIQPGDNHPHAAVCQRLRHFNNAVIKELGLIDPHDRGIWF